MGFNNPDLITRLDIDPARAQRNALVNQGLQQTNELRGRQIAEAPEDRNYLLQQREQAAQDKPIMDARSGAAFLARAMPTIQDVGSYYGQRDALITKFGVPEDLLPDQAMIQGLATKNGIDEQTVFEKIKQAYMPPEQPVKPEKPRNFETWQKPDGTTVNLRQGEEPPAGATKYKAGGEIIESDGKGGFKITRGPAASGLTKKTQGAIEAKIMGGKEQLERMQKIVSEFKPEYLEIGTRLGATWTSIKAKFGKNVDAKSAKTLTDFKKFQRKSIENINLYIKELTGAQMSEKEADRLRLAQPDPGENWWSGDDPITFKSKMDDVMKTTRAAVARWEYYRSKELASEQIKAIINSDTALNLSDMAARM